MSYEDKNNFLGVGKIGICWCATLESVPYASGLFHTREMASLPHSYLCCIYSISKKEGRLVYSLLRNRCVLQSDLSIVFCERFVDYF